MTPAEVIAMRDKLASELGGAFTLMKKSEGWPMVADWLIESGWVTSEPESEPRDVCGRRFRTYEFSYTCAKTKNHKGGCSD